MKITSMIPSLGDAANLLKGNSGAAAAGAANAAAVPAAAAGDGSATAIRDILAKYDVTDITPNDFSQMVQSLYDKGAISKQDLQNLMSVRGDLQKAGYEPDETVNLLDYYRRQQSELQSSAESSPDPTAQAQLGTATQRLGWLEKFATGHVEADAIGVSTLA